MAHLLPRTLIYILYNMIDIGSSQTNSCAATATPARWRSSSCTSSRGQVLYACRKTCLPTGKTCARMWSQVSQHFGVTLLDLRRLRTAQWRNPRAGAARNMAEHTSQRCTQCVQPSTSTVRLYEYTDAGRCTRSTGTDIHMSQFASTRADGAMSTLAAAPAAARCPFRTETDRCVLVPRRSAR
jgi:hypothetical protein